ncbi:MAG: protein translocase subunit SecD [Candidatus Omnitrophota bacterium]
MDKNLQGRILLICAVIAACLYCIFPIQKRINLGLDLKGGMHVVLKVETEKLPEASRNDAVLRAIEILRNRIDSLGSGETLLQRQGEDEIIVQLPGVTDRDAALAMIGKVAQLEFKLVSPDPNKLKEALSGTVPEGYELKFIKKEKDEPVLVEQKVTLSGDAITDAKVDFNQSSFGAPEIAFSLNSAGAKIFADVTKAHIGDRLAIVLDGEVISAPNINSEIPSGSGVITGMFTFDEASLLALALRSGALPAPMHIEEERTIGPLLGKDSIRSGINATVLGAALVFIFMLIYYHIAGITANIALFLNLLMILGTMGFLNIMLPGSQTTLTLPGIAGIILTLGMAVDANVLINERIREELSSGRPLQSAVNNGYHRAFSAIFDSNITTLIAAFMLFQFGSGPIKGFAVTLAIGISSSLFTALTVTKTIFDTLIRTRLIKTVSMFQLFKQTKIDFISKRYIFYAISIVVIVAGLTSIISKKEAAYGIDFSGGQLQEYRFNKAVNVEILRTSLKEVGLGDVAIQQFEKDPQTIIIRTDQDTFDSVKKVLTEKMSDNPYDILRIEKVGPVVGKALRTRAILAILFALGAILIYVGFRFKHFDFAFAGVVALLHDVVVAAGVLVMMGHQIDLLVVTALLTIAGFSINDTIVIYDRVRENMASMRKLSLREVINLSVNQTLSRTILTSSATLLTVIALYLFGGEVLRSFSLCLLIGFVSGVYSTVYIASPLVLAWHKK